MSTKWHGTKYPGVRYREHPTRKHGSVKPDQYFAIRYQKDGNRKEEGLGWATGGWSARKSSLVLEKLREASIKGEGETSLSEKREKQRAKLELERIEKEKELKNNITLSTFWDQHYLPFITDEKTESNIIRQKSLYTLWIKPKIGSYKLTAIDFEKLNKIKKDLLENKKSRRTIEYALAVTRQIFNHAILKNIYTGSNPVSLKEAQKYDNKRTSFLSKENARGLLTELKKISKQTHDIALTSLHCGLRAGEIFNLTLSDIDFTHNLITIVDTKTKKNRIVPMTPAIKKIFSEKKSKPNELIFKDQCGHKIKQISYTFYRVLSALKLNENIEDRRKKVTFHTLRHTFASWMVMSGVDLYTVQKLLGHTTPTMTQRYAHLAPEHFEAAIKVFSENFSSDDQDKV